jgi:hypothetical protein
MNRLRAWLDNPILVKHLRSRLRVSPLAASAVVVVVLCLCVMWAGLFLSWFAGGTAFGILLGLQGLLLVVMGAAQVGGSVGGARGSGILDFHRVSPMSPTALTLGFFFGAPVREYLLFAITLPFSLFCVAMGPPDFLGFLQLMVLLVVSAWVFHALALLNGLLARRPKATSQGIVGLVLFAILSGSGLVAGLGRAALFASESPWLPFFGVKLPWLVYVLLYEIPTLAFLLVAPNRKMASERAHVLSKPQSVAGLAILSVLFLGSLWRVTEVDAAALVLVVLYVLVVAAIVLVAAVTPNAGEYAKGIRRAERLGRPRVGYWDDLALNRVALAVMCGVVLAGATLAWRMLEGSAPAWPGQNVDFSLTIAIGVLVVAYFGLVLQFFQLAFPKRATLFLGLFLFLAWAVPPLLGSVVMAASPGAGASNVLGQVLVCLSPVTGIALSSGIAHGTSVTAVRAAAFCPALVFAFLFNNLVTVARRRVEAGARSAGGNAAVDVPVPDEGLSLTGAPSGG